MRYFLPRTANPAVLKTDAGLAVLSHEYVMPPEANLFVHSRFKDAVGLHTYEIRRLSDEEAYVAVVDQSGNCQTTQRYPSLDHARAAAVQALICGTQDLLEQVVNFIPEEVLGIQAAEMA